jgi:hypothetical protein
MKICYFDESGTGSEPVVVVVGVVVDAQRMHVTKEHWAGLLGNLSKIAGRKLDELHTKDFYTGKTPFMGVSGADRARYIGEIVSWFCSRKHGFVYSAIVKNAYTDSIKEGRIPSELATPWRAGAYHCILALQRAHQSLEKTKGHTLLIFDNKGHEEKPLAELVVSPPNWGDTYYSKEKKDAALSQIVDAPYFADSRHVPMIQVADFLAYFLRRHVELQERLVLPKYPEEQSRVSEWVSALAKRCVGLNYIYPNKNRCATAEMFYEHCPTSLRRLSE